MAASTSLYQKFIEHDGLVYLYLALAFAFIEALKPGVSLKPVNLVLLLSAMTTGALLRNTAGEPTVHDWRVHYRAAAVLTLCALIVWLRGGEAFLGELIAICAAILIARGVYRRRYRAHPGTGSSPQSTVG